MKTTLTITIAFLSLSLSYAQQSAKTNPFDTLNNLVFVNFVDSHAFDGGATLNAIQKDYPNQNTVIFENIEVDKKDSIIYTILDQFRKDFEAYITIESITLNGKKDAIYFELLFDEQAELKYLFYNWKKEPHKNQEFDPKFIEFASTYDFSGLPTGTQFSQCRSIRYKNKKKK